MSAAHACSTLLGMPPATRKTTLEQNQITLRTLTKAQEEGGRAKVLDKFKVSMGASKIELMEAKVKASLEKQAELQTRALAAEDKCAKLGKQLAENKKMPDKLME